MNNLIDYLVFEGEFTQHALEAFEASGSDEDRIKCLHKRQEAKAQWESQGLSVPSEITFSDV